MNHKRVILTRLKIQNPGQVVFFEMKIPQDAEAVIGIETNLSWAAGALPSTTNPPVWRLPLEVKRNLVFGELKLKSNDAANIFYSGPLLKDNNLDFGDYSSQFFKPEIFTHYQKPDYEEINIPASTTYLHGVYRDKLAGIIAGSYNYLIELYVWLKIANNHQEQTPTKNPEAKKQ